jgi:plasmid replication initiation protein
MSSEDRDGGLGDRNRRATTAYGARLLLGLGCLWDSVILSQASGIRSQRKRCVSGNSKVVEFAGLA